MSIKHISTAWKGQLKTGFPQDLRLYIDPRQRFYPDVGSGSPTYTLISSAENRPGSHDLTGGYALYFLDMPSTFTIRALVRPEFAYDTASDHVVWVWRIQAAEKLVLFYQASSDKFVLSWQDNGTARTMESQQFDDGVTHTDIDQDLIIDCVVDLSSGGVSTGSTLYVNRTSQDTSWSGNIDAKTNNLSRFCVRSDSGTDTGNFSVNHIRFFDSVLATQADINNDFKDIKTEEVFFPFDGHALGRTRVNVTRHFFSFALDRSTIDVMGRRTSNKAELGLYNKIGQFSDDQYGAWDPANDVFNGTAGQAYLQHRLPVIIEHHHSNNFEIIFRGRTDDQKLSRNSTVKGIQTVQVNCADIIHEIERYVVVAGVKYEDLAFSDTSDESNSLLHTLARLATRLRVAEYLADNSFDSATPANSWAKDSNVTIARVAGEFSDFVLQASTTAANEEFYQTVNFTGTRKLNVNETFTFAILLHSASAFSGNIKIEERDAGGVNGTSTTAFSLTANENFVWFEVTRTITDGDSDRLRVVVEMTTTGVNLLCDWAMLTQTSERIRGVITNSNEGSSGVESADDAVNSAWDTVGFDVDAVPDVHPWVIIEKFKSPWEQLNQMAVASLSQYFGADAAGTIKYRSRMTTSYADPTPLETLGSEVMDVRATLEERGANQIIVKGVNIVKTNVVRKIWDAIGTGNFETTGFGTLAGHRLNENITTGLAWPSTATYPSYWAKYDDVFAE